MSALAKEIAVKSLEGVLITKDETPLDFLTNPLYISQIDESIEATTSLVYELNEAGQKQVKADATIINKYVKSANSHASTAFKLATEAATNGRKEITSRTKILLDNRQRILDQFSEMEKKQMAFIKDTLIIYLRKFREEKAIKEDFVTTVDLSPLLKLNGTLTPKKALTKKAKDFIENVVNTELAEQNRIEGRHLILENRCLKDGINPPLTYIHLGTVFFAEDVEFNAKVDELVDAEIERKAEMEKRIVAEQEAKKQADINEALAKQQAEANRLAQEKAEQEKPVKPVFSQGSEAGSVAPESTVNTAVKEQSKPTVVPIKQPTKQEVAINGKHAVQITFTLEKMIRDCVSDNAVATHFSDNVLPKELSALLINCSAETVKKAG